MPILGVGVDLVDLRRVERLISQDEDIFRKRILSGGERLEIAATASKPRRVLAYAHSIAAKEAFLKALGTGLAPGMRWSDIEIVKRDSTRPGLEISGEAARVLAGLEADLVHLSLSSSGSSRGKAAIGHVQAIVMLERIEAQETHL